MKLIGVILSLLGISMILDGIGNQNLAIFSLGIIFSYFGAVYLFSEKPSHSP